MQGILLVLAMAGALVAQPSGTEIKEELNDAAITANVKGMLLINKHLNPLNINVDTRDGVVTLTGSVNDEVQHKMAEELTASLRGVQGVKNDLVVIGTTFSEKQQRSLKQKLIDKKITAAVRGRLLSNSEFQGLSIGVETVNNVVALHGVVATEIQKARIGQIAERGPDVLRVNNFLTVRPKEEAGVVEGMGRQFSDEWIESRVETAILLNRHLSIRELDVEVDDGVCVLSGLVDSEAQQEVAEKLADSIRGVKRVQNDIRLRSTVPDLKPLEPDSGIQ